MELAHGQCAASAPDTSKLPVLSAAAQARTGNGLEWSARLAFDDTAGSTERKLRTADARYDGGGSQKVGIR